MAARHKARKGIARWQRATALVPLALLAGAWSASLGSVTTATADSGSHGRGVPAVPTTAFDSPASYTVPSALDPNSFSSNPHQPGSSTNPAAETANGIPTAAMLAYQRSEAVLHKADPSCHLSWALVAAIGRVESDHGRYGGNVLQSNGKSSPGIYGVPLDGTHGRVLVKDTDNGVYDHDPIYDRAVGAMQFIPGTWQIVGVDGDGNGVRDPQDIDDSSLAAAVYLCAGSQDLSTASGQRSAVFSYNHSKAYVNLVLSIMNAYLHGNYTQVADGIPTSSYIPPIPVPTQPALRRQHHRHHHNASGHPGSQSSTGPSSSPRGAPTTNSSGPGDTANHGGNHPQQPPSPSNPPTVVPTSPANPPTTPSDPVATVTKPVQSAVDPVVKATQVCQTAFAGAGLNPTGSQMSQCITAYEKGGRAAVNALIAALTAAPTLPSVGTPSVSLPGQ